MPLDDQKELFVVVDENDKILGYQTRYNCHHDKNLIHRAVGAVIFNDKGEILMQKRNMSKDTDPGLYTLSMSGHVGKGEDYEESAEREMYEELGIKTDLIFAKKFLLEMENETEMEVIYKVTHNGPFKIDKTEIEKVEFFKVEELTNIQEKISEYAKASLKHLKIL